MSVARSLGWTERARASKTGSRSLPRSSAPASSSLNGMAPSGGAIESMMTMRSSGVRARTALSLSNCWRVETMAMRQPASWTSTAICSPVRVG